MRHPFDRSFVTGLAVLCLLSTPLPSLRAEMSPKEILAKADEARGNAKGMVWNIDIHSTEGGREQERTLKVTARTFNSLAEMLAPANVRGEKVLMLDRNMWFAKPGLSKAVPISPRQKLIGLAANGDIASTNYAGDYKVVRSAEEDFNGEPCYLFDLEAVDRKATYDKIRYWVSKDRLAGLKADFYTVSGKLFKTATFEYHTVNVDGKPRPFIWKMIIRSAVMKADVTTMVYSKVRFFRVPDAIFNLNLLTR